MAPKHTAKGIRWSEEEGEILLQKALEIVNDPDFTDTFCELLRDYLYGLGYPLRSSQSVRQKLVRMARTPGNPLYGVKLEKRDTKYIKLRADIREILKDWQAEHGREQPDFKEVHTLYFYDRLRHQYPELTMSALRRQIKKVRDAMIGNPWTQEEREYFYSILGKYPFIYVVRKLNHWRECRNLPSRSMTAIRTWMGKQGLTARLDGTAYMNSADLANALGVSTDLIAYWRTFTEYQKVLKPEWVGNVWVYQVSNIREFLIRFPKTWDRCKPDAYWLIEILAGKTPGQRQGVKVKDEEEELDLAG